MNSTFLQVYSLALTTAILSYAVACVFLEKRNQDDQSHGRRTKERKACIDDDSTTSEARNHGTTSSHNCAHPKHLEKPERLSRKKSYRNWDPHEKFTFQGKQPGSAGLLILLRHGQSVWNRKPREPERLWRYAGSIDVPLSDEGIDEALEAGEKLQCIPIDIIMCSELDRAQSTVSLALSLHSSGRTPIVQNSSPLVEPTYEGVNDENPGEFIAPVYISSALNERNFGDLQGVPSTRHADVVESKEAIRHIRNDFYTKFPGESGESSCDVFNRTVPFLQHYVLPHLQRGHNVLISSHGFAIRTLIKYLDNMSDEEWNAEMNIEKSHPEQCQLLAPTGVPLVYKFNNGQFEKMEQSRRDRTESLTRSSAPY